MRFSTTNSGLFLASLTGSALAGATYSLRESIIGDQFYIHFNFEAIADPTHGRVNYVDQATAQSLNLTYATSSTFILRADDTTVLSPSGPGRNSVRIRSNGQYSTHVAVFDIAHMPEGCGTWPAVWETDESNWPRGGEVDIVEGVNNVTPNTVSLHTSPGCSIPASGVNQRGTTANTDCDANANGCGVKLTEDNNSYGPNFNNVGGGWYVLERTNNYLNVYFWERNDPSVPSDVKSGATTIDTSYWGTPAASFPDTDCNFPAYFDANNIIINLTFCGDWAGNQYVYSSSGCPSDCIDYVNNNPSAFTNAYFQFGSINIYE